MYRSFFFILSMFFIYFLFHYFLLFLFFFIFFFITFFLCLRFSFILRYFLHPFFGGTHKLTIHTYSFCHVFSSMYCSFYISFFFSDELFLLPFFVVCFSLFPSSFSLSNFRHFIIYYVLFSLQT